MNWEAVGAIGESLSAVAVLITLVYLAMSDTSEHPRDEELRHDLLT